MIRKLTLVMALSLAAPSAMAGTSTNAVVDVDLLTQSAYGDYYATRNSTDFSSYIGCGTTVLINAGGGQSAFGFCQAADAALESLYCTTVNPELLNEIRSIGSYSSVSFSVNNKTGECTRVGVGTNSFALPGSSSSY